MSGQSSIIHFPFSSFLLQLINLPSFQTILNFQCSKNMNFLVLTSWFITILVTFIFPTCFSTNLDWYTSCGHNFVCGNVSLGFPFWGGSLRPKECGYLDLELSCNNNITTKIVISSMEYNVLDANPNTKVLRIAREDLYDGLCLQKFVNTTLNYARFSEALGSQNITILYGCQTPSSGGYDDGGYGGGSAATSPGQFTCKINGVNETTAYYQPGATGPNGCHESVIVPIVASSEVQIEKVGLGQVIDQGFEVSYKVEDDEFCAQCAASKGRCGFDLSKKMATCLCLDGSARNESCTSSNSPAFSVPGKKSSNNAVIIGIAIAGGLIAAFVALCSLFYVRRRKRLLSQTQNKDFHPGALSSQPLSSNGFHSSLGYTTSPSTHMSHQSIPSYTSSKSDLENSNYLGLDVKLFSYVELEEATENFHESRELGDGGFGTVYYGELQDGRVVAVKRLYENSVKRMGQFMNEVKILARLRHKNLVTLYGCTSKRSRDLLLVYEYIPNGTVADHLHGKYAESNKLPWNTRLSIAVETAEALAFLHENDVIHRDVKTTNILLDSNFQVKVADFGLSRLFPNDVTHVSTAPQGTPGYVDPDYYQCYRLTEKSDVYSFGVVLMELISSKLAVDITRHRHDINLANMAVDRIQKHALQELVDPKLGYDKDYLVQKMVKLVAELAFQCLQQDSEMRPSMKEVLESLKAIQKELTNAQKQVVVDIHVQESDDDVGLLKNVPPPLSPETETTNRR